MQRIGVIGAGQMGNGIAHVCAVAGLDVRMVDVSEDALTRSRGQIEHNLGRQIARGKLTEAEMTDALARIVA